jgi:hypothetical protein
LRVKEERNVLHKIKRRKATLRRNCLLKHIIEGKIEGMGRRRRRRKQLLDDFKERAGTQHEFTTALKAAMELW